MHKALSGLAIVAALSLASIFDPCRLHAGQAAGDKKVEPLTVAEKSDFKATSRYQEVVDFCNQLAKVSPRAKYWTIGKTEEGRDIVALAIADEATIKSLEKYRDQLAALTDPRKTTETQAQALLGTR